MQILTVVAVRPAWNFDVNFGTKLEEIQRIFRVYFL